MSQQIDGPGANAQQLFKPGDAGKLPTKHFPETTKMAQKGGKTEIAGPNKK